MEHFIQPGRRGGLRRRERTGVSRCARIKARLKNGYTLIELVVVLAIISILLAVALPMYQKSLRRTKEAVLKNNLFTLRTVIDEYTFDKKKAPQTLQDLVDQGYLRQVPIDPITGNDQWRIVMEDAYIDGGPDAGRHLQRVQHLGSEKPGRHAVLAMGLRSQVTAKIIRGASLIPGRLMVGQRPLEP